MILFMISSPSFICPLSISPHCALNHPRPTPSTALSTQGRLLLPQYCCPSIKSLPPITNLCYNLVGGAAPAGLYRVIMFPELGCLCWNCHLKKKEGCSFRVVTGGESCLCAVVLLSGKCSHLTYEQHNSGLSALLKVTAAALFDWWWDIIWFLQHSSSWP